MLRTWEGKKGLFEVRIPMCDCSRSNQMPPPDQITEIAPISVSEFTSIINTMISILLYTFSYIITIYHLVWEREIDRNKKRQGKWGEREKWKRIFRNITEH